MKHWLKQAVSLVAVLAIHFSAPVRAEEPGSRQMLPAQFVHGRIFVTPRLQTGQVLRFYTDSGGGWNMVPRELAERFEFTQGPAVQGDGPDRYQTVHWPVFATGQSIPAPIADTWTEGRLVSASPEVRGNQRDEGFLGSRWFGARVWEFDYPGETLAVLEEWMPATGLARTPMTTLVERGLHFPRIQIEVDGQTIDMLFDTGATVRLGVEAAKIMGLAHGTEVAGSFITSRQFQSWREKHPQWRVVEHGDEMAGSTFQMIEVPDVRIAGVSTGPVWFALRPDHNFTDFMSSMTDAPVEGAIGGSAFARLRLIADYPSQMLYVHREISRTESSGAPH